MINIYMTSTLIEARQHDSQRKNLQFNGAYVSTLKNSVTIENGDTLTLRNVFIDSAEQSANITVQSPTTLSMTYIPFTTLTTDLKITSAVATDVAVDPQAKVAPTPPGDAQPALNTIQARSIYFWDDPDPTAPERNHWKQTTALEIDNPSESTGTEGWGSGMSYCPCIPNDTTIDHTQVTSISFRRNNTSQPWGNFNVTFYYRDLSGGDNFYIVFIPLIPAGGSNTYTLTFDAGQGPLFVTTEGFNFFPGKGPISPAGAANPNSRMANLITAGGGNIFVDQTADNGVVVTTGTPVAGAEQWVPVELTRSIVIDPGEYAPAVLANIISRKFNAVIGNMLNNNAITGDATGPGIVSSFVQGFPVDDATVQRNNPLDGSKSLLNPIYVGAGLIAGTGTSNYVKLFSMDDSNSFIELYVADDLPGLMGGCANFELDFDNQTQTFKIPKLHTEYYYNGAAAGQPVNSAICKVTWASRRRSTTT